jgi:peptide/nickel transport system substrate-binding protein
MKWIQKTGICLLAFLLAGCLGTPAVSEKETERKILKVGGPTGEFGAESLDPANGWDGWIMSVYGISETLYRLDENAVPQPWLAESASRKDDLTWQLNLRSDVRFSNGKQMDAEAVKQCLERTYEKNVRAESTLDAASIQAEGQTLIIQTVSPEANFLNAICDPLFAIYDASREPDPLTGSSCTGPYTAEKFAAMESVNLIRNEAYWGNQPQIDEISVQIIDDPDTLNLSLQSGEIDLAARVSPASAKQLSAIPGITVSSLTTTRSVFLQYNLDNEMLAEGALRKALSMCIDRQGFADVVYSGYASPANGVWADVLPFGGSQNLQTKQSSYDPVAAGKVLEEAGITDSDGDGIREMNGKKLSLRLLTYSYNKECLQLADMVQSAASKAGIELSIESYEVLDDSLASGDFDIAIQTYAMAPTGTPGYFASMVFESNGSSNYGHYSNPETDRLIGLLTEAFDPQEQYRYADQISEQILRDQPVEFAANIPFITAFRDSVTPPSLNPSEYYLLDADLDLHD